MKKMLRKILPPLLGASLLAPAAWAQTVHMNDGFDGATPPSTLEWTWTALKGTHPDNWAILDTDPDGTTANQSLWIKGGNVERQVNDNFVALDASPSNEEPLIWQVRIYDHAVEEPEGTPGAYAELRDIVGASWQATLFAVGVFSSPHENYDIRAYPDQGWITLDTPRSEGWHTFSFVIRGDSFDVYVDQDPYDENSVPDANATNLPWSPYGSDTESFFEAVRLGGAASTTGAEFLFDDVYLANDPLLAPAINFVEHPSPSRSVRLFGETMTFNVVATGSEPLTYQWLLDGEPLVDDARISGSTTDTLTITGTDGLDSGAYSVTVTDSLDRSRTSNSAELVALYEHEIILNSMDLPTEAFVGTWGTYSETAGWFGWKAASTVNVTDAEGNPNPEALATFQPTIAEAGWYEVWTYFPPSYSGWGNNRTNEAPYHVNHAGGEDLVFINQQHPNGPTGEQWVHVGTYEFDAGTDGSVVISNHRKGPSGDGGEDGTWGTLVIADAVRWIPTEAPVTEAPTVSISSATNGDIELMIVGQPETEYTVEWVANLGGTWDVLGTQTTDPSGAATFTDSTASSDARRFYRVVIP